MHRIIVRCDEEHFHCSPKPLPCVSRNGSRGFDLLASRQERHAILESPSKVLRVCQLESVGGNPLGQAIVRDLSACCRDGARRSGSAGVRAMYPPHHFELPVEGG